MPPFKQVNSLENLCTKYVSRIISSSISCLADGSFKRSKAALEKKKSSNAVLIIPMKEVQRIKKYIGHNIPKNRRTESFHLVIERVTDLLTKSESLRMRRNMKSITVFNQQLSELDDGYEYVFIIMFDKEIEKLNFTPILHKTMKWVDTCRLNSMDPTLNYTKIETIFLKHLAENARTMTNIISLSWPHLISGELIRLIGQYLKELKILTLACSCEMGPFVEEERKGEGNAEKQEDLILSLSALFSRSPGDFVRKDPIGCPLLKKLVLPNLEDEDRKGAEILRDALLNLPCLEYVTGISTLMSLAYLRENPHQKKLSLKAISDYDQLKKRIIPEVNFLKDLLPNLRRIELRVSKDLTKRVMKHFEDIEEMSVDWPDFHLDARKYTSLVNLSISLDYQCCWPLLIILSRSSPQLKHLTLEQPTFQVDALQNMQNKIPRLPALITFKLIRSSFIEFTAFKQFVLGCPNLQDLDITLSNDRNYVVDEFGDQLIRAVAPLLHHLKRFTAESLYKYNLYLQMNCMLSMTATNMLLTHCPNLTYIGHLDSWDVTDAEVKEFHATVKENNWDLEIA